MKVGFFEQGESILDTTYTSIDYYEDHEVLAEEVVEYIWDNYDGYEYIDDYYIITLVYNDIIIGTFSVELNSKPTFTATMVKDE